ncbi:MAG TPA: IS1595 family transposase [Sphingomicrobium sp.]|jgi:transposase-like protein
MKIDSAIDVARFLTDEAAAQDAFAQLRWPNGVTCPLCEGGKKVYEVSYAYTPKGSETVSVRKQWKCGACRKKFSVTSRSIFEGAHISVGKWIYAIFQMCSSKKGVSANQLSRELDISYKSAWFMCHRVREAMLQEPLNGLLGSHGVDGIVELDETYVGGKKRNNRHADRTAAAGRKVAVMTLIDREGEVKTVKVPNVRKGTLQKLARPMVDPSATIMTDRHLSYQGIGEHFAAHWSVDHSATFVRGIVHTNFAESYHSLLKRGIVGAFHHVSEKHLPRYLAEFDRRWNTRKERDGSRAISVVEMAFGKRLTYKATVG